MKKISLILLLINLLFWGCQQNKSVSPAKDQITFTGKISNAKQDQIVLSSSLLREKIGFYDGSFHATIDADQPVIINFSINQNSWGAFAKPGDSIHVEFDSKEFPGTVNFSAPYAEENQLKLSIDKLVADSLGNYGALYTLAESDFLSKLDIIKNVLHNTLGSFRQKNPDADTDFLALIEADIQYALASPLFNYKSYYPIYSNDTTYEASESLEAKMAEVKVENPALLNLPRYTDFINGINLLEMAEILNNNEEIPQNEKGLFLAMTQAIDKTFKDPQVKEYLLYDAIKMNIELTGPNDIREDYASFLAESKNELYNNVLKKIEAKWGHLQAGMEAPDFSYPDIDSSFHALSDYKGKYVFIDVWATWCGPCLMQQPALEAIEEQYKDNPNIVFMGVSIDKNGEAWKKMVTQKDMDGVQVLAEAAFDSKITKGYNISAIPRYIMIDKEGKLIDASAPRPMSDDLKVLLSELLQP